MSMTDPIADFLTRIRNGIMAAHETVEIPSSQAQAEMARILTSRATSRASTRRPSVPARAAEQAPRPPQVHREPPSVISGLRRVSRPGQRTYVDAKHIPKVLGGMGTAIVSTSRRDDRPRGPQAGVGGEVVAEVW